MSVMDRRSFLKLSAATGLAAVAPAALVYDYRDAETRMLDYVLTHYDDEILVIEFIKLYSFSEAVEGDIVLFIRKFVRRQPHVIAWLRSRVVFDRTKIERTTNNYRYNLTKTSHKYAEKVRLTGIREWNKFAPDFGFKQRSV